MGDKIHKAANREELAPWLKDREDTDKQPIVMVVRGSHSSFADTALGQARGKKYREVVLLEFTPDNDDNTSWFQGDDNIIAAAFNTRHVASAWVKSEDANSRGAVLAFSGAQSASRPGSS